MNIRQCWSRIGTVIVLLILSLTGQSGDIVTLTMQERIGVERKAEPIVIGVPLPQGLVKSASELALTDVKGKQLPSEFVPVVRWQDKSLRWVHVYFLGNCPASGQESVKLIRGALQPSESVKLDVREDTNTFTVDTGVLKFVVKKKGFNLIDQAWVNGKQIIASHTRGPMVIGQDGEYLSALDSDVKVEKEEAGNMHVVLKATGAHKNASNAKKFDFVARIYVYAGSPVVRVTYTFIMRQGDKKEDFIPLFGLHIDLPTTIKNGHVLFGEEDKTPKKGKLNEKDEAFVLASDSDSITFGGAISGQSKAKSIRAKKTGWCDLSDNSKGLSAGVRWFWQMHPKSVEVTGTGVVRIGLYPVRSGKSEKIYSGVARTHYIQLVFHDETTSPDKLAGYFAGLEYPLRPFASPRWYCRDTKAFGNLVEADLSCYKPEYKHIVEKWDKAFDEAWVKFDKMMDGRTAGGGSRDDYGLLEWGDNFHYTKNAAWGKMFEYNGNYYGYPHMMLLQFVRTGKLGYFDHFESHACHVADVHTVHYDPPTGRLIGASRYCPPGEHVRFDDPPKYPVYISNTFNHFKNEGVFERWYFLADHRMLDVLAEQRKLVTEYKGADKSGSQPRGAGHLMITLAKYYEDTLEPIFLARAKEVFEKNKDTMVKEKNGKPNFQQGIQLEGARRYYEISGDPTVIDYFRKWADFFEQTETTQTTAAQAFGLLWAKTGDKKYFELGIKCVDTKLSFSKEKDFALTMRNGPYFFYYLSNEFNAKTKQ